MSGSARLCTCVLHGTVSCRCMLCIRVFGSQHVMSSCLVQSSSCAMAALHLSPLSVFKHVFAAAEHTVGCAVSAA